MFNLKQQSIYLEALGRIAKLAGYQGTSSAWREEADSKQTCGWLKYLDDVHYVEVFLDFNDKGYANDPTMSEWTASLVKETDEEIKTVSEVALGLHALDAFRRADELAEEFLSKLKPVTDAPN